MATRSDPAVGMQGAKCNRWKNANQLCPVKGSTQELLVPHPFIPHLHFGYLCPIFSTGLFDIEDQQCKFYASMMKVRKYFCIERWQRSGTNAIKYHT